MSAMGWVAASISIPQVAAGMKPTKQQQAHRVDNDCAERQPYKAHDPLVIGRTLVALFRKAVPTEAAEHNQQGR